MLEFLSLTEGHQNYQWFTFVQYYAPSSHLLIGETKAEKLNERSCESTLNSSPHQECTG